MATAAWPLPSDGPTNFACASHGGTLFGNCAAPHATVRIAVNTHTLKLLVIDPLLSGFGSPRIGSVESYRGRLGSLCFRANWRRRTIGANAELRKVSRHCRSRLSHLRLVK